MLIQQLYIATVDIKRFVLTIAHGTFLPMHILLYSSILTIHRDVLRSSRISLLLLLGMCAIIE